MDALRKGVSAQACIYMFTYIRGEAEAAKNDFDDQSELGARRCHCNQHMYGHGSATSCLVK